MRIKVSEASEKALDYLVAKIEGRLPSSFDDWRQKWPFYCTEPSSAWPIITRVIHAFDHMQSSHVCAIIRRKDMSYGGWNHGYGPTALIAAMRCYVISMLGQEVDVPEELLA